MRFTIPAQRSSLLWCLLCAPLLAQPPDLRGIWMAKGTAYLDVEKAGAVVEGKIPYLPEAQERRKTNFQGRDKLDPQVRCFQAGIPRATALNTPFQIFQNASSLYFVYQDAHAYRIAYLDRPKHNDGLPFAMGDSRAHWEGNTLVVDVASFSGDTWLDRSGNYHSDALHVVERYTRQDATTLLYEARLEDPKVYARPWTLRLTLKPFQGEIKEDECEETSAGRRHAKN